MTLEQTTKRILAAAAMQDLAALEAAGKEREAAIAALGSMESMAALRNAVAASIAAGEEAKKVIRVIKHRLFSESRRLTNIERGFVRVLHPSARHQVDCKG